MGRGACLRGSRASEGLGTRLDGGRYFVSQLQPDPVSPKWNRFSTCSVQRVRRSSETASHPRVSWRFETCSPTSSFDRTGWKPVPLSLSAFRLHGHGKTVLRTHWNVLIHGDRGTDTNGIQKGSGSAVAPQGERVVAAGAAGGPGCLPSRITGFGGAWHAIGWRKRLGWQLQSDVVSLSCDPVSLSGLCTMNLEYA